MRTVALTSLLLISTAASMSAQKVARSDLNAFSAPRVFRIQTLPVLGASKTRTSFLLITSWIPGKDRKGSFRYQMEASAAGTSNETLEAEHIKEIFPCRFTLELDDASGFVLRRISIPFTRAVSNIGNITELQANDAEQMDLDEYKMLINGGSYNVSWVCNAQ